MFLSKDPGALHDDINGITTDPEKRPKTTGARYKRKYNNLISLYRNLYGSD